MKKLFIFTFTAVLIFSTNAYAGKLYSMKKNIDYTQGLDIREGDFIFQHLPGRLTRVIADVTDSQYSHCGIVVEKYGDYYVLEAIGPVKETPINQWIRRGIGKRITIVRLKDEYRGKIPNIIKAARKYMFRPYDIQYEWDDEKIYCSELIYKSVKDSTGIKLAEFKELGGLNWRPHEYFIRYLSQGELPLDRKMITPEDLVKSAYVDTIYSSFSPQGQLKGIAYHVSDLEGEWNGDYTFPNNQLIQVSIDVAYNGQINEGQLAPQIYIYPSNIRNFNQHTGQFTYVLYDNNGTKTTIKGRVDPTKDGIFGDWADSRGYRGVFSLSKKSEENEEITYGEHTKGELQFLRPDDFVWQPAPQVIYRQPYEQENYQTKKQRGISSFSF